ncbi:MAG: DUF11 domain-containing protein [Gammaproteobacteria bacterium]|nr:DUF11 domain-containing protein [Gammaproteobacteria bacterium]
MCSITKYAQAMLRAIFMSRCRGKPRFQMKAWLFYYAIAVALAGNALPADTLAATIQGTVFNDWNGNGAIDVWEQGQGRANVTVFIRDNALADAGQGGFFTVQTDANGAFSSIAHNAGSFSIWTEIPFGWRQIAPVAGEGFVFFDTTIAGANDTLNVDFAIHNPNPLPCNPSAPEITLPSLTMTGDMDAVLNFTAAVATDPGPSEPSCDSAIVELDFGDGNTAATFTASHTYTIPGTYTVAFIATDIRGTISRSEVSLTVANVLPGISLNLGSTDVRIGDGFAFDAAITDTPSDTHTYLWEFGDGNMSNILAGNHVYALPGTHTVKLTVTDSFGAISKQSVDVTVENMTPVITNSACFFTDTDGITHTFPKATSTTRIEGSDHLKIFCDENRIVDLRKLSEDAISAIDTITIEGGVFDLRGISTKVFRAGASVEFFAKEILLSTGVALEDLVNAPIVTKNIIGEPGAAVPVPANIDDINTGYNTDIDVGELMNPDCSFTDADGGIHISLEEADSSTHIEGSEHVVIFGGENWIMDLRRLSEGAISAIDTITIAVGEGSVIDLRGINTKVFRAGTRVEIFANAGNVLFSSGINFEDLAEAPIVRHYEKSNILYNVELSAAEHHVTEEEHIASGVIKDNSGNPLVGVTVQMAGQSVETDDGGNWEITELGEGEYEVTASKDGYEIPSQQCVISDSEECRLTATAITNLPDEPQDDRIASGVVKDKFGNPVAGVTVQVDGQTAVTGDGGNWEIIGLSEGEYTVTASKDGYNFSSPQCVISDNEECQPFLRARSDLKVKIVPDSWETKQGENQRYTITISNQGDETATGVVLTDIIPAGTEVVSLASFDGGDCDSDTVKCVLPDLAPGDSVSARLVISSTQLGSLLNTAMAEADGYPADLRKIRTWVTNYLSVFVTDTPDPVLPGGTVRYTVDVALNSYAPEDATDVRLSLQLPGGIEFQSITADHGNCDTGSLPKIVCSLPDLSLNDISRVTLNAEVLLEDPGLLSLTHDAAITANEYSMDTARATTKVDVGDAKVDMVLVVDVTGSMREEINGVIRAIKRFITDVVDPNQTPSVALVTFGDEVRVKAVTSDLNVLLGAVEALRASGGGTCPEASAEALNIALDHLAEGGFIFFTTDASPYPEADIPALIERLQGINFVPVISGDCSQENAFNELPAQP